ncbi:MAG TPA: T9SS type A sorting domain-containing protein, partial [bacterium]
TVRGASPNPFNPTTTLSFELPQAGSVKLSVYNVTGREVATLVNGWRDAGNHEVTFDATGLASGLYVYQLTAGDFHAIGKMMLLK